MNHPTRWTGSIARVEREALDLEDRVARLERAVQGLEARRTRAIEELAASVAEIVAHHKPERPPSSFCAGVLTR